MESHNESSVLGLKRKPATESGSLRAYKAAHVGAEHGTSFCRCALRFHCSPTWPSLAESCFNFLNSGVPRRIMFYNHGDWMDFPESAVQTLITGFKNEKSSITFSMGDEPLLLDFLSMVVVNLRTRKQRSVAWIDEADQCFFPTNFDQDDNDSNEWDLGIMGNRSQRPEVGSAFVSPPEVVKNVVMESEASGSQQRPIAVKISRIKLETLERGSESFLFVQNLFLSGMGPFAMPNNILYIHRYAPKDINGQNRLENFERQIRVTEEERGDANVRYGWFGSKKLDIARVLFHGFGTYGKPTEGGALGTGLYLTPESRAFASVNLCDVDEKGILYMILCRVILGDVEQVHPGSKQYFPSSGDYDSGADNLSSPKCYVVWPTHLNTYLHPEYLVSFKLASNVRDYLFGLKDVRFHVTATQVVSDFSTLHPVRPYPMEGPTSPWVPFTVLFEAVQASVSPLAMELLLLHHQELKSGIITREELVKKMSVIVGNQLLVSVLMKIKHSPASWYEGPAVKKMKLDDPTIPTSEPDNTNPVNTESNGSTAPTPELTGATG